MNVAIINCFDTFWNRQESLRRFFLARGDTVTCFLSDYCHMDKCYRAEAPAGYTLIHAPKYKRNLSLTRMYSHVRFSAAVSEQLRSGQWDLIWVIVPPNSLVKYCAGYKRVHPETKLIFDVNDLWPESLPLEHIKFLPPFRCWQALRDHYLSSADYVVTECEMFRERLGLADSDRCSTVYFCKPEEHAASSDPAIAPDDNVLSLCYLGSINHIVDIDAITDIIRSIIPLRPVTLHVIGAGESRDQLLARAKAAGAKVVYHGAIYDTVEKQKVFDQCHFGLNVMRHLVCVGLTMKSVDYLSGGLPLINTIRGDTWDLVERYGLGINCSDGAAVDWEGFDVMSARLRARAFFERELTYDRFAQRVEEVLSSL